MQVRVVTKEREVNMSFDLSAEAPDNQVLEAVERRLELNLKGYMVTREEDRVLISPSPIYG